jgi:hypothetical protein
MNKSCRTPRVRKGQPAAKLSLTEFSERFHARLLIPLSAVGRSTETLRLSLSDWLDEMKLVQAGTDSCIDRYIDYFGKYATSHDAFDEDEPLHEEVRNAARALIAHGAQRRKRLRAPDERLKDPRPK